MHRCVFKVASCLSPRLHSQPLARVGTHWVAALSRPATVLCVSPLLSRATAGHRAVHASAVVGSNTETLSGTGGQMLIGKADAYEGFLVSPQDLPSSSTDFDTQLQNSIQVTICHKAVAALSHACKTHLEHLQEWQSKSTKGVWINIPADKSELVPIAIKHGFQFHHAERAYVMMTRWLPDTENTLPPNASHQVGQATRHL